MFVYTLCVPVCARYGNRGREGMTPTSKQSIFGLCQQLPPLFLKPYNANTSSHLKVSCNTLPSSLRRGQKPFCCWGCTGSWLVCRQDGALVAVMWHRGQPIVHPKHTEGAFARSWLSPGAVRSSSRSLGQSSPRPLQQSSPKVGPCCVAPKVLEMLQLNQANTFQRLHALHRHLTSCSLRSSLGITEMLNNGEGELHLCFCWDYMYLPQAGLCW